MGETKQVGQDYCASPLKARLVEDLGSLNSLRWKSERALDILNLHPEFELFIELLGLLPIDMKFNSLQPRPQIQKPLVG